MAAGDEAAGGGMTQCMPIEDLLAIPCPWDREPSFWQTMCEQLDRIAGLLAMQKRRRTWLTIAERRAA